LRASLSSLHTKFGVPRSYHLLDLVTYTDRQTPKRAWLYRLSLSPWSRIYILYGICHASFCLLLTL